MTPSEFTSLARAVQSVAGARGWLVPAYRTRRGQRGLKRYPGGQVLVYVNPDQDSAQVGRDMVDGLLAANGLASGEEGDVYAEALGVLL